MKRAFAWSIAALCVLAVAGAAAWTLTPWPKALLIRHAFDAGGEASAQALAKHVPAGISEIRDLAYRDGDRDARLDVFFPETAARDDARLPTVVWIHGGGWVAGDRAHGANYLRILAAHGFTTVAIGYSIAPGKHYPLPVVQANAALGYLVDNAARLHVDPTRIVLAGDSAGAQIAAQVATLTTSPAYAQALGIAPTLAPRQLRATVLACGAYDLSVVDHGGAYADFLETVLWAYSGTRRFRDDPKVALASVTAHVTADFPASFITAGNGDPLEPQSRALAARLATLGVDTDTLFFAADRAPALPHEYQFDLDDEAGREALARIVAFLDAQVGDARPTRARDIGDTPDTT
ncbi:alpha/beta hydrolase [Luteimonas sp. BDR2-5]|uniref:alpha/beta hydrolase n=1 Tax=Proluteimonas luteida TaxID=2878685 RepID=UPI001E34C159|nr:alpha/beta hydrolase [Luteimonas sp. BDR2-5]MCD9030051.1 alpha/beta hydrolase [Luteimonas sp. BDR2-5]